MIPYAQKSDLLRACIRAEQRRQAQRAREIALEVLAASVAGLALVGAVAIVRWIV